MINSGPELDKFVVEPWMEYEPFDPKLAKEIFFNHPYKILIHYLEKLPPKHDRWEEEDINDFYFKMLDDYNRYGISFIRQNQLYPGNFLFVIENDNSKKPKYLLHFDSKYEVLFNGYDKKTLLFNKAKKYDLNKRDRGEKPLSKWEKEKRDFIRENTKINKYLQAAMMDPDVYYNDEIMEDLMSKSEDYYAALRYNYPLLYTDNKNYDYEKYFKKRFKNQIDIIKKLLYRINEGNDEYLGIIGD